MIRKYWLVDIKLRTVGRHFAIIAINQSSLNHKTDSQSPYPTHSSGSA